MKMSNSKCYAIFGYLCDTFSEVSNLCVKMSSDNCISVCKYTGEGLPTDWNAVFREGSYVECKIAFLPYIVRVSILRHNRVLDIAVLDEDLDLTTYCSCLSDYIKIRLLNMNVCCA